MNSKPNFELEKKLRKTGFKIICGIDEAGRGAWAGPLVAGAVILRPTQKPIFQDSKKLNKKNREKLYEIVIQKSFGWSAGVVEVEEINHFGIQSANYLAFQRAIEGLKLIPDCLLVDHYRLPGYRNHQISLTRGDQISQTIAAASIIAKVTRDRLMKNLARETNLEIFKFDRNFGYGTKKHCEAIRENGLCPHHRIKFCLSLILEKNQKRLFENISIIDKNL